jgi:hypothetical protein
MDHAVDVGTKAAPVDGQVVLAHAQQPPERSPLVVEPHDLVGPHALPEQLVRSDDRVAQRRVHPRVRLRLERVVAPPFRVDPLDRAVHLAQPTACTRGRLRPAVDEQVHEVERAPQPAPRVPLEVRVLAHTGRHGGVRDLEEERDARARDQAAGVARIAPDDRARPDGERVGLLRCHPLTVPIPTAS